MEIHAVQYCLHGLPGRILVIEFQHANTCVDLALERLVRLRQVESIGL